MLKSKSFRAGIHPPSSKITAGKPIERAKIPPFATILLLQHAGSPCKPLVKEGDEVKTGQKIGDSNSFVSAPVHSSISGVVREISTQQSPMGREVQGIIIESDGRDEWVRMNGIAPETASREELLGRIREAGIVGLGGGYPTHAKLSPREGKEIETLILNGAECESYVTADHRTMLEHNEKIIKGMKIIMKVLDAEKGFIGIEDNKMDAIKKMREAVEREGDKRIEVISLKTKYPQGEAGILVKAVLDREKPSGGHFYDIGVIVQNVSTAKAIYDAIYEGIPLIERVVTVTGDVKEPKNLLVRIGTPFRDLIEECGGFRGEVGKILKGGLMGGIAQWKEDVPTIKGTNCILVLGSEKSRLPEERSCIRCGRCVEVCPIGLIPTILGKLAFERRFEECQDYNILDCIGCGSCTYVCPSKIPIVQLIKYGKEEIRREAG